jgi:glucose/mannose-6-phosphate isomerase
MGMGGSSIAGQYVQALFRETAILPIVTIHDSILPAYVDKRWVTIAVSYSGNTEETLLVHGEAKTRGCRTFVIASGGKLLSDNESKSCIALPPDFQPRAAFPLIFSAVLHLVECLLGKEMTDLSLISDTLMKKGTEWETSSMAHASMAIDFLGGLPVFIGADYLSPVAYRAKCQINENAKAMAYSSELPEANHNEIESFSGDNDHSILPVFLRSAFERKRLKQRFDITTEIYEEEGFTPIKINISSSSRVEEALLLTYFLDLVSVELADIRSVNPISVDKIAKLKLELSKTQSDSD